MTLFRVDVARKMPYNSLQHKAKHGEAGQGMVRSGLEMSGEAWFCTICPGEVMQG
jgi:hypothetical protein